MESRVSYVSLLVEQISLGLFEQTLRDKVVYFLLKVLSRNLSVDTDSLHGCP